jgi:Zn-dependent protease
MRMSWKLGRVAGIDVYLHPTFLLVLTLTPVLQGGAFTILLVLTLFGCVLLHEFGHALTARRFGIETEDITLYPIGGVARLRRMPRSPGAELAIALAGPAVNIAIAAALALLLGVGFFDGAEGGLPVGFFLWNLMWVNLLLAGFNLIPAFPMDGGRVFRAALSGWLGRVRATTIAAGLGRGLALLFGLYSLGLLLFDGQSGSWLHVALAAFIYVAAGSERNRVIAEERPRSGDADGIWTAPAGFHWVSRGDGVWQLAPVTVHVTNYRNPGSWR